MSEINPSFKTDTEAITELWSDDKKMIACYMGEKGKISLVLSTWIVEDRAYSHFQVISGKDNKVVQSGASLNEAVDYYNSSLDSMGVE